MGAQQRHAHAGVGVKEQVGIGGGQRAAHPGGRGAKAVNALLGVRVINGNGPGVGGHAHELDIIHPQRAGAEQSAAAPDVDENIVNVVEIGVRVHIQRNADMHPVGVGGGHGDGAINEVVLAVGGRAHAKPDLPKSVRPPDHLRGGTGGKADIALQIGEQDAVQPGADAVETVPDRELVVGREIGHNF